MPIVQPEKRLNESTVRPAGHCQADAVELFMVIHALRFGSTNLDLTLVFVLRTSLSWFSRLRPKPGGAEKGRTGRPGPRWAASRVSVAIGGNTMRLLPCMCRCGRYSPLPKGVDPLNRTKTRALSTGAICSCSKLHNTSYPDTEQQVPTRSLADGGHQFHSTSVCAYGI
jgi:hypothetical protein